MKYPVFPIALTAVAAFVLGVAADRVVTRPEIESNRATPSGLVSGGGDGAAEVALESVGDSASFNRGDGTPNGKDEGRDADNAPFSASLDDLRKLASGLDPRTSERRVREALRNAGVDDLKRLAGELAALNSNDPRDRSLRMTLYRRWADRDPLGTLDFVLASEGDFRVKADVIHSVFEKLGEGDFAAAKKAFAGLENPELRESALNGLAQTMGRRDPAGVARFIDSLPMNPGFGHFFREWAVSDPGAASNYVLGIGDGNKRAEWIRGVAGGWATGQPDEALAWAASLESPRDRSNATRSVVETIAQSDPARAAALVEDLPAGDRRRELVEGLAWNWARQDLEGALGWAESLGGSLRSAALEELLPQWARTDPAGAADYVAMLPPSERSFDSMRRVARIWAESDRESALGWALTRDDPAARERVLSGISAGWAEADPQTAADFAVALESPAERRGALESVARRWADQDLGGAMDWMRTLPAEDRGRVFGGILDNIAGQDPRQAADIYSELTADVTGGTEGGPNEIYRDLAGEIAERWSRYSPAEAAVWATGLPDSDSRRRAVEVVADQWVRADPMEASQWISELPEGRTRDSAAERIVDQISESDPDAAFQWALSVGDEGHQTELMRHVINRWKNTDPQAARAIVNSANVSAEQREQLNEVFE